MSLLEIVLIVAGISLDIFASMEIEGAMLAKIKQKTLFTVAALVVLMQQIFFFFGYLVSTLLVENTSFFAHPRRLGYVIAMLIFFILGGRLAIKAVRREMVNECRKEIMVAQYMRIIAVGSIYTILAGIASGFLEANPVALFVTIIISSIVVTIGGIYTGYHFGFEGKNAVYWIGAILLWIAGIFVLLENVLQVIG